MKKYFPNMKYIIRPIDDKFKQILTEKIMPQSKVYKDENNLVELDIKNITQRDFYGNVKDSNKDYVIRTNDNEILEITIDVTFLNT